MTNHFQFVVTCFHRKFLPLLFCLFAIQLFSQVQENLNFLDHHSVNSMADDIIVFDDYLLAADHRGYDKISFDYKLNAYNKGVAMDYKFYKIDDSTVCYASWFFDCGDCTINELRTTIILNDTTIHDNYIGIGAGDHVKDTYDITHDSTGGWWCLTNYGYNLLHLKQEQILDTFELNLAYPRQIYTSCNGDIYIIDNNYIRYFDGEELLFDFDLPLAKELHYQNGYNYIFGYDKLYKYSCDLSTLLKEWTLPQGVSSIKDITIYNDDRIHISVIGISGYAIANIDSSSNITYVHNATNQINESISGVKTLSDTTHLIFGQHEFSLNSYPFYRTIDVTKELDYPKIDVSISNFNITYDNGFPLEAELQDTIVQSYHISPSVTIENNSDKPIYSLNLHSSIFNTYDFWVPFTILWYQLPFEIAPYDLNEIGFFGNRTTLEEAQNLSLELVGANYKFLSQDNVVLQADLTSSLSDPLDIESFNIAPNPSSDRIKVEYNLNDQVYILNTNGEVVIKVNTSIVNHMVNVSALNSGTYFVVVRSNQGNTKVSKFIKM